ncbi:MAG: hypothetical protein IT537_09515 [Hyphomicrobiales bacterium]|nr:hypothetical protein [Hyphomicrobiales bacterium]
MRGTDNFVATLESDTIRYKKVKVGSTDGTLVSVAEGLAPGERVAINLPDEVTDGSRVQPIAQARAR